MKGNTSHSLQYGAGSIVYELLQMPRKSLEISVYPDSQVLVKAPITASLDTIEKRIKKRASWIRKQQDFFDQFSPRTPERQYLGGESHLYLGRKYRLKIECSNTDSVKNSVLLKNGYFFIETKQDDSIYIKKLLDAWYDERAYKHFSKIYENCWANFSQNNLQKPTMKLQRMKTRWGSLSPKGKLTLNTYLIKAPKECIEYVITHELCHLVHLNHSRDFYTQLAFMMPDWAKRKHKLEISLV